MPIPLIPKSDDEREYIPTSSWFEYDTKIRRYGKDELLVAHVRYDNQLNNKYPHFSITGTGYSRVRHPGETRIFYDAAFYWSHTGGCLHDEIAEVFPELEPLIKWHLCDVDGSMHYVANSLYWHKLWGDAIAGPPWDQDEYVRKYGIEGLRAHFLSTALHGEVVGDPTPDELLIQTPAEVEAWLRQRRPMLREKFLAALDLARSLESVLS